MILEYGEGEDAIDRVDDELQALLRMIKITGTVGRTVHPFSECHLYHTFEKGNLIATDGPVPIDIQHETFKYVRAEREPTYMLIPLEAIKRIPSFQEDGTEYVPNLTLIKTLEQKIKRIYAGESGDDLLMTIYFTFTNCRSAGVESTKDSVVFLELYVRTDDGNPRKTPGKNEKKVLYTMREKIFVPR